MKIEEKDRAEKLNGLGEDTGADSKRERLIFPTVFWADAHILGGQQGERFSAQGVGLWCHRAREVPGL